MTTRDPYEVLGVPRTATTKQIRTAYVERARRAHPDIVGGRGLDVMRSLNEAWDILKDDARRSAWNATSGRGATAAVNPPGEGSGARHDSSRPFWTGAMGPAPGRPSGPVLDFGIYFGWSLGEVARRDPGYLAWLRDRPEATGYLADIERMLDPAASDPAPSRRRR